MTNHYVDNKRLFAVMTEYHGQVKAAKEAGVPKPQVPNYVGHCILQIANRLSYKPNFVNYSYREEMVSDGVENCISYIDNFDPTKSDNPFAYFTQIIYFAFLRRIQKEKKHLYIKHKVMENSLIHDMLAEYGAESGDDMVTIDVDINGMSDFVKSFEKGLDEKRTKRSPKNGIEKFADEEKEND